MSLHCVTLELSITFAMVTELVFIPRKINNVGRSCLRKSAKRARSEQTTTLESFGVAKKLRSTSAASPPRVDGEQEVAQPASRTKVLACQGVVPSEMLPAVSPGLLKCVSEFCTSLPCGTSAQKYLVSMFAELYANMEKQASHVEHPGYAHGASVSDVVETSKVLRSKWCGKAPDNGPPGMTEQQHMVKSRVVIRKIGSSSAAWMGCETWPLCGHCAALGTKMRSVMSRLTLALNAKLSLTIPGAPRASDDFLSKILHCSAAGCPNWNAGPLQELRVAAKARLDFLSLGSEVGGRFPENVVREEVAFLKRVRLIVLESPGVLQGKAAFGALNAVLTHMCRREGVEQLIN